MRRARRPCFRRYGAFGDGRPEPLLASGLTAAAGSAAARSLALSRASGALCIGYMAFDLCVVFFCARVRVRTCACVYLRFARCSGSYARVRV